MKKKVCMNVYFIKFLDYFFNFDKYGTGLDILQP